MWEFGKMTQRHLDTWMYGFSIAYEVWKVAVKTGVGRNFAL